MCCWQSQQPVDLKPQPLCLRGWGRQQTHLELKLLFQVDACIPGSKQHCTEWHFQVSICAMNCTFSLSPTLAHSKLSHKTGSLIIRIFMVFSSWHRIMDWSAIEASDAAYCSTFQVQKLNVVRLPPSRSHPNKPKVTASLPAVVLAKSWIQNGAGHAVFWEM